MGATYSFARATRENAFETAHVMFEDIIIPRTREVGAEAEFRFAALRGVGIGGEIAQSRAQYDESYRVEDNGLLHQEMSTATKTLTSTAPTFPTSRPTRTAWPASRGSASVMRPVGRMTLEGVASDGVDSVAYSLESVWMDYSGLYLTIGAGFDWGH